MSEPDADAGRPLTIYRAESPDGRISLSIHDGLRDDKAVTAFLDGLELAPEGTLVEVWAVLMWSDVSSQIGVAWLYTRLVDRWARVPDEVRS